jgi:spore germination protein YaaH
VLPAYKNASGGYQCTDNYAPEVNYGVLMAIARGEVPPLAPIGRWTVNDAAVAAGNGSWATFDYRNTSSGARHQVWMDTPATLRGKFLWARGLGLRGLGVWTLDSANVGAPPSAHIAADARALYEAFDAFFL